VNRRLAYVAISRGRYDAQIYTNDKAQLAAALDRDVSHRAAIEPTRAPAGLRKFIRVLLSRHLSDRTAIPDPNSAIAFAFDSAERTSKGR